MACASPSEPCVPISSDPQRTSRGHPCRNAEGHLLAHAQPPLPAAPFAEVSDHLPTPRARRTRGHLCKKEAKATILFLGTCSLPVSHTTLLTLGSQSEWMGMAYIILESAEISLHLNRKPPRLVPTWENMPKGVCRVCMTCPMPRHVGHVLGAVPGRAPDPLHAVHVSRWLMSSRFSAPKMDSLKSKVISILCATVQYSTVHSDFHSGHNSTVLLTVISILGTTEAKPRRQEHKAADKHAPWQHVTGQHSPDRSAKNQCRHAQGPALPMCGLASPAASWHTSILECLLRKGLRKSSLDVRALNGPTSSCCAPHSAHALTEEGLKEIKGICALHIAPNSQAQ